MEAAMNSKPTTERVKRLTKMKFQIYSCSVISEKLKPEQKFAITNSVGESARS